MASFSYQTVDYVSAAVTFTAPTGGALADSVTGPNDRGAFWVKNAAAGGSITVTFHTPGTMFGVSIPDIAVSIADGSERIFGPLVNDLADPAFLGVVPMSITGTMTGVTAAALRI